MGTRTRNADSGAGTTQPASSNPDGHRHTGDRQWYSRGDAYPRISNTNSDSNI
ncbi:hypothetical protein T492DRAFT_1031148 [Pavlovales sp. CCMP2436]|nr:hypothetical protein T492DRAFT_1031148 [Pavlovales sp. CCMP2436]